MFLATSGIHLKWKLKLTPEEALKQAVEGIKLAKSLVSEVEFSAEDATRTDYGYLREVLQATFEAGATTNLEVIDAQRSARDADAAAEIAADAVRRARLDLLTALGRFPQ